ncbi:MAG: aminoacyl-tRNA hydrolase [Bacteroidota bacterium]
MTWPPSWWPFGRQPAPAPAPASVGAGAPALDPPESPARDEVSDASPSASFLIVGLGNPGPQYVDTRHNAGFLVVDRIAERLDARLDTEAAGSLVGTGVWRGQALELAQPQTFMNRSGGAVEGLLRHAGLQASQMLLVYDDLALPVGQIRLRGKGSAGGHNGVQDVIDVLGSTEFPRLRVGVGDRFDRGKQVDFVLSPFDADEHDTVDEALDRAVETALAVAHDGLVAAMNVHNRKA